MPLRTKIQVALTLLFATLALLWAAHLGSHVWLPFWLLLAASILSSGMVVELPKADGVMSVNFPFILMGLVVLSPLQALLLAGLSIAAQSRMRVRTLFTAVQISFNIANAVIATACAYGTYAASHHWHMTSAPALSLAAVAYFLWNTGTFAAIIAPAKGESVHKLWWAEFPWYLPFYLLGASLAALTDWLAMRFGWSTAVMLIPATYTLYRAYIGQSKQLQEREHRLKDTEALHLRIIESLAMAIEAKDQGTHDHLFRVRNYVQAVGEMLTLGKLEIQALQTASLLHDIGKLAVPEHIINKPGKLTPEEFEKMKIHPGVGAEILERVRFPYPVVPIVRSHHEWWNGAGYPDGLAGYDIPIGARILTVVDCYDALVSDRPYRKGMSSYQAMEIIRSLAGKQFDPDIVRAFERCHLAAALSAPVAEKPAFTPLNTEVEVWRGLAPGAGFEAGSDENASTHPEGVSEDLYGDGLDAVETLVRIASASQEAQTIFEMVQAFGHSFRFDEVLSITSARLATFIPHAACALYLKEGDAVQAVAWVGEAAKQFAPVSIPLGMGVSGWSARSGKPLLNGNAAVEPGCPSLPNGALAFRAVLSFPLFDLHGQLFAVLTFYARTADCFKRHHLRILKAMEAKLALALGNALHMHRAEIAVETDFATGLPNARRFFLQLETELESCRKSGNTLAIALCHLNALEALHERKGQSAGTRLLGLTADEFRRGVQGAEMVARMGQEEFAFLLPGLDHTEIPKRLESISGALATASRRSGQASPASASFGVAVYPADGTNAEDLVAYASRRVHVDTQQRHTASSAAVSELRAPVAALTT